MITREEQAYLVRAWHAAGDATASPEAQQMIAAEIARVHQAFAQLPISVQFVQHDPYRSFEHMRDQVQSTGQMLVYMGASDTPLWDPQTNWMARAVHDWDHIVKSCDFSMEGEAAAFRHSAACRPGLAPLYLSEIMLQAAIANYEGAFVPQKLVLAPEVVQKRARQMRGVQGAKGSRRPVGDYRITLLLGQDMTEHRVEVRYVGDYASDGVATVWLLDDTGNPIVGDLGSGTRADAKRWFKQLTDNDVWQLLAAHHYDQYTNALPRPQLQGVGVAPKYPPGTPYLVWSTAGLLRVTTPEMAMVHLRARSVPLEEALVIVSAAQQLNEQVDGAPAALSGVNLGAAGTLQQLTRKDLRVGDDVGVLPSRRSAGVSGKITSIGRTNVKIESHSRFAPDGPLYTHTHTVAIEDIGIVVRDGVVVFDRRTHLGGVGAVGPLEFGPPVPQEPGTAKLRAMKKLRAKNDGTANGAIISAAWHAKKYKRTMYAWLGNSYMNAVWNVSEKPSRSRFENIGEYVFSVTPDLELQILQILNR
jgi:hypothetical protein